MARSKSLRIWGLLGVGALLYAPHLPAPFVADDHFIFWRLQEGGIFGFATRPPTGFYRPLISLQYYLDYWLGGIQPLSSHLVDLAWHLLCAWLVAIFCKVWLIDNGWSGYRASRAALLAMALFFGAACARGGGRLARCARRSGRHWGSDCLSAASAGECAL
jgi:hypothetical protein